MESKTLLVLCGKEITGTLAICKQPLPLTARFAPLGLLRGCHYE
jgi:hypothetical protein